MLQRTGLLRGCTVCDGTITIVTPCPAAILGKISGTRELPGSFSDFFSYFFLSHDVGIED